VSRASRKEARRERLRLERERQEAEALTRPRPWDEEIGYHGVGWPAAKVLYRGDSQSCLSWDIRDLGGNEYAVYRSASRPGQRRPLAGGTAEDRTIERIILDDASTER